MASACESEVFLPSTKRARKFDSKAAMNHYQKHTALVNDLHRELRYTMDTLERARGIITGLPHRQPFTKCREVLAVRHGVICMMQEGNANYKITRNVAPETYIDFMASLGPEEVSTMAALRETTLKSLECNTMDQLDVIARTITVHVSNAQKIFQASMKTAELIEHMAMSEDILIPPHMAVLEPRPHAAAPTPLPPAQAAPDAAAAPEID